MKVKEYMQSAEDELKEDAKEKVVCAIKESLKQIRDCEKTMRKLKKSHEELLETDVDDIEDNDYEY